MKLKHIALAGAIALGSLPFTAFADMSIVNNTNSPATASVANPKSPCSGVIGDRGIIKPHGTITIPDWAVNMYCKNGCTAHVYMNKNCAGKSIAEVNATTASGVTQVNNQGVDGYHIEGIGKTVSIEGGPARKWYEYFFRF